MPPRMPCGLTKKILKKNPIHMYTILSISIFFSFTLSLCSFFGNKLLQKETQQKIKPQPLRKFRIFLASIHKPNKPEALTLSLCIVICVKPHRSGEVAAFTWEKSNHLLNLQLQRRQSLQAPQHFPALRPGLEQPHLHLRDQWQNQNFMNKALK